jgi:hypothetical protein
MAKRRGRPSKALLEQILKQDARKIADHFLRNPLRQPVDPQFDPYYQRILNGDLAAVSEYCERTSGLDSSFYELIGRLVPLQFFGAAKEIISDVKRRGPELDLGREGYLILPDWVIYQHWYDLLKERCQVARQFIRDKYKAVPSAKREQVWNEYCAGQFLPIPTTGGLQSDLRTLEHLKTWGETEYAKCGQTPHRRDGALWDLVERFLRHHLVPRPVFFELAKSNRRADAKAELDRRYRQRRFVWASSFIARKYACAMVGISPSSVSHRK